VGAGLLATVVGAVALWYFWLRAPGAAELVALLPPEDGPTLAINVRLLRKTGLLETLAGRAGAEESEYKRFVAASGFNYREDLDYIVARFRPKDSLFIVAGRFDLPRLAQYARGAGGRCAGELCAVEGSSKERQISWTPIGRDTLGMVVGPDPLGAALLGQSAKPAFTVPQSPVWLHLPGSELKPGPGLPPGLSVLLSNLEGANEATIGVEMQGLDFVLALEAPCPSGGKASEVASRLQATTELLKKLLAREHQQPSQKDLSGVLAGGTFKAEGNVVKGSWPVARIFLQNLTK
jgi:hypothetical protein